MAKHDEWETPPNLFLELHQEFGFDLDACASATNHKVARYITAEQNALTQHWEGRAVWCNPPYSQLPAFTQKAALEAYGGPRTVVMLVPAYTDTLWWRDNVTELADEIRFLVGRLRFFENGAPGRDTARFPSAVVCYKPARGFVGNVSPRIRWWDWRDNG